MPVITVTNLGRLHATIVSGGVAISGVDLAGNVTPTSLQAAAQPIINTFDDSAAADTAFANTSARTVANSAIDNDKNAGWKSLRGAAAVLVDEVNILRQWTVSFKAQVALATTLADLKTRVATLPDLPDRTLAQAKTAIQNKITSGVVD